MSGRQFLKPETGDIGWEVWMKVRSQPLFWSIFSIAITLSVVLGVLVVSRTGSENWEVVFLPFFAVGSYLYYVYGKIESGFWKKLAELNGWEYKPGGNLKDERGLMFRQGRSGHIRNAIQGVIGDRPFRIFSFSFETGRGRFKQKNFYTVFAFKFNGSFPHIYLDSHKNYHSISAGERIAVPEEFKNKFSISAPRKYEIEALQIFTPDILGRLSRLRLKHDIELIGGEMIVFAAGRLNSPKRIEEELNDALEIEELLGLKLDKIKFEPIGDMPYIL